MLDHEEFSSSSASARAGRAPLVMRVRSPSQCRRQRCRGALRAKNLRGCSLVARDCMPACLGQDDWCAGAQASVLPLFWLRRGG